MFDSSCISKILLSPNKNNYGFDADEIKYWMPVDQYIAEFRTRYTTPTLFKIFYESLKNNSDINYNEPFKGLFTQGMVCHETYKDTEKMVES